MMLLLLLMMSGEYEENRVDVNSGLRGIIYEIRLDVEETGRARELNPSGG